MSFWKYSNPNWEECFEIISPFWAKIYFATNFGPFKYLVAGIIFKNLSRMEEQNGN